MGPSATALVVAYTHASQSARESHSVQHSPSDDTDAPFGYSAARLPPVCTHTTANGPDSFSARAKLAKDLVRVLLWLGTRRRVRLNSRGYVRKLKRVGGDLHSAGIWVRDSERGHGQVAVYDSEGRTVIELVW